MAVVAVGVVASVGIAATGGSGTTNRTLVVQEKDQALVDRKVREAKARRAAMQPLINARLTYLRTQGGEGRSASTRQSRINACQNKKSGALRISKKCKKNEKKVSWNTTGPAGPAGPAGAAGATGATGPAGAAAAPLVYEDVYNAITVGSQAENGGTMTCSAGGTAINGGYITAASEVLLNSTLGGEYTDEWIISFLNYGNADASVIPTLYCLL